VYAPELTEMFARALLLLGTQRAFVVHGHDGLDEISVCAPTRISEVNDGLIRTYDITPEQFFGAKAAPDALQGAKPEINAEITRDVLAGAKGPKRDVVLLNASAALVASGKANDFEAGLQLAQTSIDNGAAAKKLDALVRFTQENG
jgi:anthranilate phosphoribosyltransferase